jgi:hypothetical protein
VPAVPIQETAAGIDLQSRIPLSTTVVASPTDATETIIASITLTGDVAVQRSVIIRGFAAFTVGTSGTAVRLRIRQTNVSGTVKGDTGALTGGISAGNLVVENVVGVDAAPSNTGQVYVLTLQVTAGAAASTVSAVELDAIVV